MLLFCDSFDHYNTATLGEKYQASSSATIVSGGRVANCLALNGNGFVQQSFQNAAQLIVGFAINPTALPNAPIVSFFDLGTQQGQLKLNSAGGLSYYDGHGNLLASSPNGLIPTNTFSYIEVSVLFSTTATGSVAAQINGQAVFDVTGVVTSFSGNNYANTVQVNNGSIFDNNFFYDDLYVCNGSGTVNNNFLGDVSVVCLFPNNDGQVNQFSQQGGTMGENYTCVDDPAPDGDLTYVYSSTPGNQDFYKIQSVGNPQAIVGVQIVGDARKDDAAVRLLALGFGNGTSSVFDTGFSLTNSYVMYTQPYDQNPITQATWQIADLNSGQLGVQVM